METLGPGDHRASPASSSTGSLDLRRLSGRADSAYSSFSADSGCPEPRSLSPGTDLLPYLDWDYVRVVWGGPTSGASAGLPASPPPLPAHERSAPGPPQAAGPLSRQATPLLYALAAEAEAAARAAEPPSPPAARAAYRQRLQGAQRRVLRETSFQRKELRMSLPARLRPTSRPTVSAEPATTHTRSFSLSHPAVGVKPADAPAPTRQQRQWCFSEPGKLDRVGRSSALVGECPGEACSSPSLARSEPQELQKPALADFRGHQVRWLPKTQPRSTEDSERGSQKLSYRPASRSLSASGEGLDPWGEPGGAKFIVQAVPQEAGISRPLYQNRHPRFFTKREAAVACPAEGPQSSLADCTKRVSETCTVSLRLPSVPDDDEVFPEEAPPARMRSPEDSHVSLGVLVSVHTDQQPGVGSNRSADEAAAPSVDPLRESPETAKADSCWQELNSCVDVSRATCYSPSGTANGDTPTTDSTELLTTHLPAASESEPLKPLLADTLGPPDSDTPGSPDHTALALAIGQTSSRPAWPSPCLQELVKELARLDPSLSDTFTTYSSPEPLLTLLDGLVPLPEVRAAMRPVYGEAGEEAAGTSESGSYLFSSTQLLSTSQEEARPENLITCPAPPQPCGQGLPEPSNSNQTKKRCLADLLKKMLQDLQTEQEQLQRVAQAWAESSAALEAAVGQACAPRELERFSRFMVDLERVLGLLLLLGSRLARVHCALARQDADSDPDEKASLLQRLRLLQRQQEDSKELKEHVVRRERALREVLVRALPAQELRTYCALLARKAAILAQQRSLDECVRLLQDQLDDLRSDLGQHPTSPRLAWPPGTCPRDKSPIPPLLT
ncbi:protein Shroom1 [Erinaceus europaeus]|uniref:Protein Shroom1 n=1 Tax=Erinaceus europaeus TaxID=9365 RepID=A0A1S2ZIT1_ERIEU|nr:protein Shroom1 [Erinaceus europaeus]XP_060033952.1 protein Shroom1 [Erinaceus europaeus]